MRFFGLWHPITVKKEGEAFILIAGFYRCCAAIELGWKTIRANIYIDLIAIRGISCNFSKLSLRMTSDFVLNS